MNGIIICRLSINLLKYSLFLFICVFLFSCTDCGDQSAPLAKIVFTGHYYQHVKGVGIDDSLNIELYNYRYPLSIDSDTTAYVFYDTTNFDTLIFKYRRNFIFESNKCGFIVTLDSFEVVKASHFDSVIFNVYEKIIDFPKISNKNQYFIIVYN